MRIDQLDAKIVQDKVAFNQKSFNCSYLSPSVDIGPKRLKIRGPSFPSTVSEVEISYRFQEDSDLASQNTQWSMLLTANINRNFWKMKAQFYWTVQYWFFLQVSSGGTVMAGFYDSIARSPVWHGTWDLKAVGRQFFWWSVVVYLHLFPFFVGFPLWRG